MTIMPGAMGWELISPRGCTHRGRDQADFVYLVIRTQRGITGRPPVRRWTGHPVLRPPARRILPRPEGLTSVPRPVMQILPRPVGRIPGHLLPARGQEMLMMHRHPDSQNPDSRRQGSRRRIGHLRRGSGSGARGRRGLVFRPRRRSCRRQRQTIQHRYHRIPRGGHRERPRTDTLTKGRRRDYYQ